MRIITDIQVFPDYKLLCGFSDGTKKIADTIDYLNGDAFAPLKDVNEFSKVKNCKYYVLWPAFDLDLSADTLWHIGNDITATVV